MLLSNSIFYFKALCEIGVEIFEWLVLGGPPCICVL